MKKLINPWMTTYLDSVLIYMFINFIHIWYINYFLNVFYSLSCLYPILFYIFNQLSGWPSGNPDGDYGIECKPIVA